jgi:hypothetical protein
MMMAMSTMTIVSAMMAATMVMTAAVMTAAVMTTAVVATAMMTTTVVVAAAMMATMAVRSCVGRQRHEQRGCHCGYECESSQQVFHSYLDLLFAGGDVAVWNR